MQPAPMSLKSNLGQSNTPVKQQLKQAASPVVLDQGHQNRQIQGNLDGQQERQMRGVRDGQLPSPKHEHAEGQEKEQVIRQQDGAQEDAVKQAEAAVPSGRSCRQDSVAEQPSGYVDIPRRIAWERLATPGSRSASSQVI